MKFLKPEFYQDKVNTIFKDLKKDLLDKIPYCRVEHVGSSAIPGTISKGDLDVFVGIDQDKFENALVQIKDLGFIEKQDTLRTQSLCMLITDKYNHDVAVQLVANHSEWEDFLLFRDLLRSNPILVEEYNQLKLECVDLNENDYRLKKSQWIESLLKNREY